jgi:hypothetical protein
MLPTSRMPIVKTNLWCRIAEFRGTAQVDFVICKHFQKMKKFVTAAHL